jgi:hypothetical protein
MREDMNAFDKVCAGLAFLLGVVLLVLGVIGTFTGCRVHLSLPVVLGGLPALVGWGIVKGAYVAWTSPRSSPPDWRQRQDETGATGPSL